MTGALSHIRICDFTGQLAGAGATKWLAAFGADVIRIEDPVRQGRWDILRGIAPFVDDRRGINLGGGFNNHNTNKKGITLNLRTEKGKDLLTEIIAKSDAVTENFAAGVLEKWGFGYDALKAIKPDIVYVSNCGFGHKGPYSRFKTWGPIVQAISGLTFSSALPGQPPAGWGYSYMDHTGGYYMAMAIMLALLERDKSGKGQWVDLACTEAGLSLNGPALLDWTVNNRPLRKPEGINSNRSQHAPMAPHGIYPCLGEDEWIAVSCRDNGDWQKLSGLMAECPQGEEVTWRQDFNSQQHRLSNEDELDEKFGQWTANWQKFDLQQRLRQLEIPVAAVQKPQELIDLYKTTANFGLWPEVKHAEMGEVRVDGLPAHFSETDWAITRGGPCLSEHTDQVLVELLGKSPDEVATLREAGVI
jgi:benzylsuccinate CoA-transferase BbsF subunit